MSEVKSKLSDGCLPILMTTCTHWRWSSVVGQQMNGQCQTRGQTKLDYPSSLIRVQSRLGHRTLRIMIVGG